MVFSRGDGAMGGGTGIGSGWSRAPASWRTAGRFDGSCKLHDGGGVTPLFGEGHGMPGGCLSGIVQTPAQAFITMLITLLEGLFAAATAYSKWSPRVAIRGRGEALNLGGPDARPLGSVVLSSASFSARPSFRFARAAIESMWVQGGLRACSVWKWGAGEHEPVASLVAMRKICLLVSGWVPGVRKMPGNASGSAILGCKAQSEIVYVASLWCSATLASWAVRRPRSGCVCCW